MSPLDRIRAARLSRLAPSEAGPAGEESVPATSGRRTRTAHLAVTHIAAASAAALVGLASASLASTHQDASADVSRAKSLAKSAAQSPLLQSTDSAARSFWLHQMLRTLQLSDRQIVSAVVLDAEGHPISRVDRGWLVPTAAAKKAPASGGAVRSSIPGGGVVQVTLAPRPLIPWAIVAETLAALALGAAAWVTRRRTPAATVAESDDLVHGATAEQRPAGEDDGDTKSILLVDDDQSVRRFLETALSRSGYRVTATATPLDALRLCRAGEAPDLLISDIVLPTMSGHELSSVVTRLHPGARVLLMSGYPEERELVWAGATFLAKPFSLDELLEAVRTALEVGGQASTAQAANA